jgi:hypothetical protein
VKNASHFGTRALLALLCTSSPACAGELTTATLDAGGGSAAGGVVEVDASFGGFAGFSDGAASVTSRAGFSGQLYDIRSLTIAPDFAKLEEFGSAAFNAQFRCDDDSLLPTPADAWSVSTSFASVSPDGKVGVGALPDDLTATLTAVSGAWEGTAELILQNTDPDNYGPYAGDGLPDAWQTLYFGEQSPDATPATDPDADGQDNLTEYLAGTNPLDPASFLTLRFGVDPAPASKLLDFAPFLPDRSYTLEWSASLSAPWMALPGHPSASPVPGEGVFTDENGGEQRKFYRLRISAP